MLIFKFNGNINVNVNLFIEHELHEFTRIFNKNHALRAEKRPPSPL